MGQSWIEFWDRQTVMDDQSWSKNVELFLKGAAGFFPFAPDDRVLDIGAGPGFLGLALRGRVAAYTGVDTSPRYVDEARRRLAGLDGFEVLPLGQDYLDFSFLRPRRFTRIVCASVVQYYQSVAEVERLVEEVQALADPGATLLIADIVTGGHGLADLAGLLKSAWENHYLLPVLRFIVRSLGGDYGQTRKSLGLLELRRGDFDAVVAHLGLHGEWRDDVLTLNKNRRHYLIRY
jgi:SAM-dependent methyltransferase